jgi:plasmid stability protein
MATLTIRNVPAKIVKSLKRLAKDHERSMEQEVRALLQQHVDRRAVLAEIKASWARQSRPTTPQEIEEGIHTGRP